MLKLKDGIKFIKETQTKRIISAELDKLIEARPLMKCFYPISNLCISILQNKKHTLSNRFILLGIILKSLDELEASGEYGKFPDWLIEKQKLIHIENLAEALNKMEGQSVLCTLNNIRLLFMISFSKEDSLSEVRKVIGTNLAAVFEGEIEYNTEKYAAAVAHLDEIAPEYLFENVMVNYFFGLTLPFSKSTIWEDYTFVCQAYSLLRFMAAGYMADKSDMADLVYLITVFSRSFFHNKSIPTVTTELTAKTNSNSLAHMAIVVKG